MEQTFDLDAYRKELMEQRNNGDLTEEELAEALTFVDPVKRQRPTCHIEIGEREENDPLVCRLEDLYYRQLFGRPRNEDDHRLITEVLLGSVDGKPGGALWYALEPTPDYKRCVYLDMLYVLEEFRGTKLGTNLLLELVQRTPEDHCIITYAWKPAIEFYRQHGFLTTNQKAEKEGMDEDDVQEFLKMVLPLTNASFNRYAKDKGEEYFEGFEEMMSSLSFRGKREAADFTSRLVNAIEGLKKKQEADLSQNPFTVFLYKKAGLEHALLP